MTTERFESAGAMMTSCRFWTDGIRSATPFRLSCSLLIIYSTMKKKKRLNTTTVTNSLLVWNSVSHSISLCNQDLYF